MEEEGKRRDLTGIKKLVEELDADFIQLLYDIRENKEVFETQKNYDCVFQNIFNLYKMEYQRIYKDYELEVAREIFEKDEMIESFTPRAWRFLCFHHENIPAKLLIEKVDIKAEKFFKESEAKNDAARPDYMPKLWLTRQDKKDAKRAEKAKRKAEKKAKKAAQKSGEASEGEAVQPPEVVLPSALMSDLEQKKQARLRALEERRKSQKAQEDAATSAKSPK